MKKNTRFSSLGNFRGALGRRRRRRPLPSDRPRAAGTDPDPRPRPPPRGTRRVQRHKAPEKPVKPHGNRRAAATVQRGSVRTAAALTRTRHSLPGRAPGTARRALGTGDARPRAAWRTAAPHPTRARPPFPHVYVSGKPGGKSGPSRGREAATNSRRTCEAECEAGAAASVT